MPRASSCVLIGGYTLRSEPVTRNPAVLAIAATPPMKVPAMPKICTCIALGIRQQQLLQSQGQQEVADADHCAERQSRIERRAPNVGAGEQVPSDADEQQQ